MSNDEKPITSVSPDGQEARARFAPEKTESSLKPTQEIVVTKQEGVGTYWSRNRPWSGSEHYEARVRDTSGENAKTFEEQLDKIEADKKREAGLQQNSLNIVKPFQSKDEMVQAMSDPRYKRDPAYRRLVRQRIAASDSV